MLSHDELMAAKVAMLERVVKDLLITHFRETADPIRAAEQYASQRGQPGPHSDQNATQHQKMAFDEVWAEFLDDLVAQTRATQGRPHH